MSQTTQPPPQKSNNTAFIGAAALMLLVMGGLIYWKLGQSAPTPEVKAPPPPPPKPTIEDTLPPPPPPPEPTASAAEPTQKKVRGGGGGGGCAGECAGRSTPQLESALRSKAGQARGCYERALRQNSMLQGKLTVAVRVGPTGEVCSASIAQDSVGSGVGACVLGMFRGGSLPPPQGGCVDTAVPLNFVPKQ
ncbi:MAG: AgmX/PglI C-terminal domain-containing protein [Polyangiaceae bacterium]|nr:AgmX/PglI C-terminal domain-containing protein [Polyangiaceae bacterium]